MSAVFSEDSFIKKLDNVTPTQDSIQSLALWIIHHKLNHEAICKLWLKKLNDSSINVKQRLALFYLANDVIQTCKRKNARIFQDTFKRLLNEAVQLIQTDSLKKSVERIIDVWSERNVYDKEFVSKLKENMYRENASNLNLTRSPKLDQVKSVSPGSNGSSEKSDLEYQKLIAEFEPKKLCESVNSFFNVQKETNLSRANVEATRLLDVNVDHIKQYRDKSQCANFKTEFENSCLKLEDFLAKLSTEALERKRLIQLMEQSEIFYDAQFKDATTVATAYKNYGSKVHTVKRKLDEIIVDSRKIQVVPDSKLDTMDMEMSDDDNQEMNTNQAHTFSDSLLNIGASLANAVEKHAKRYHRQTSPQAASTNLDPRQNRNTTTSTTNFSSNKKVVDRSFDKSKRPRIDSTSDNTTVDLRLAKEIHTNSPSTPVRDETDSPCSNAGSPNPLDFLTKFINKSSNQPGQLGVPAKETEPKSANLTYLVSSLKKFVNTGPNNNAGGGAPMPPVPLMDPSSFSNKYFDPSSSFQGSFLNSDQSQANSNSNPSQQRAGTPTKDELYQAAAHPPLPPSSPQQFTHQQPPPPPPLTQPQTPTTQAPLQFHPMFQMQPPPPPPMNIMSMMPTPQLMIDPSTFNQAYGMFNQPPPQMSPQGGFQQQQQYANKTISPTSGNKGSDVGGYWGGHDGLMQNEYNVDSDLGNNNDNNNNTQGSTNTTKDITNPGPMLSDHPADNFQTRNNKFTTSYDHDSRRGGGGGGNASNRAGFNQGNNNYNKNNYQQQNNNKPTTGYQGKNYNSQYNSRIPTINSQRGENGGQQGWSERGRGGANNRYNNNRF